MIDLSNDNVVHIKKGNVEYIQFKKLLEHYDKIQHCYTLIGNNNTYEVNDSENYKELYDKLQLDINKLVKINNQIHSNLVEVVEDENKIYTQIDGLVTNKKGLSFALRFADCTPIFLYDPIKNVIGDIHSGWRGTVGRIAISGAKSMIDTYNCNPKDIIACIGPCIGKCHFKVDEDVKDIFYKNFSYMKEIDEIIIKGNIEEKKQKYYIDTNIININLLKEMGIQKENIIESGICTACNPDIMHSHRINKEKAGRNVAIIGLK